VNERKNKLRSERKIKNRRGSRYGTVDT
jgi:hypothetical protein